MSHTTVLDAESAASTALDAAVETARERLDAHVREIVHWHFSPETGSPFWLERSRGFDFDPLEDVRGFDDLNWLARPDTDASPTKA